jgi:hypothetical protein
MSGKFKYVPAFQSEFVDADKKNKLIESNEPFEIKAIRFREKSDFGPQFYLGVQFMDGSEGTMTFVADGTVYTRDDLLTQAQTYLKGNPDDTLVARLSKEGRTTIITIEDD